MTTFHPLPLGGAYEILPAKFGDERGLFSETYNKTVFTEGGIDIDFVQDNHSFSAAKGVLRGLHFQTPPFAQDKLVRVIRGRVCDVLVDVRAGSPTYKKWVGIEISADKWNQVLVPKGFLHGFVTLEENTEFLYKVSAPSSPYSASKAASDHLVRAWGETYGLPVMLSNCSNNYGPYHFPEKLIPLVILNALSELSLPIYGKGENVRDWLYVTEHARALDLVATRGKSGESYNIGGNAERQNVQVVHAICEVLDEKRPRANGKPYADLIEMVSDRPGHDRRYAIDASKAKRELGWSPTVTFEQGLSQTIDWYLENEWWWGPIREKSGYERLGIVTGGQ